VFGHATYIAITALILSLAVPTGLVVFRSSLLQDGRLASLYQAAIVTYCDV
jgi:hypothetical protein